MIKKTTRKKKSTIVNNGLQSALGLGNDFSFGSEQLSQSGTLFKNLRWYLISNLRQLLSQMYVEIGLVQTIVDIPVDDALRGGVDIKTSQLDPDQIKELNSKTQRQGDLAIAGQAAKWNRLFGGAGIIIVSNQSADEELNIKKIQQNTPLKFHAADLWELFFDLQNMNDVEIEVDTRNQEVIEGKLGDVRMYNFYGERLHQSRVLKLVGTQAPSFIRPRVRGWGLSVCESLVRPLNQFLKATDLGFEVLDEFKLDIFKIKDLAATLMQTGGEDRVRKRVQLANMQKNYQNALTMDKEDDYEQKQLTFAGLADTMKEIRLQLASELRMPQSKLFGQSATGFNSGEDDIENYNAMIESTIREQLKFPILTMLQLRCQQLFGFIPNDLSINFKSLRVMTSEQEQNVKNSKFNRVLAARTAGEITSNEFRNSVNQDELLPIHLEKVDDDFNISIEQPEELEDEEENNQTQADS